MSLAPISIRHGSRELVGILHRGRQPQDKRMRPAVLMLNPFGQEAVRVHRLQRVLADRLARAGHDVLRFDWFGSGDSAGDDLDADLPGWVDDALAAHRRLAMILPGRPIAWLGIRLGASVALLAQPQAQPVPAHLILWDPILDGRRYLKSLLADHERALLASYSLPQVPRRFLAAQRGQATPDELIGFAVSADFVDQIRALDERGLLPGSIQVTTLGEATAITQSWRDACAARGTRLRVRTLDISFDWTSEEALNTALVPAPVVAAVLGTLDNEQDSSDRA